MVISSEGTIGIINELTNPIVQEIHLITNFTLLIEQNTIGWIYEGGTLRIKESSTLLTSPTIINDTTIINDRKELNTISIF